MAEETVNRADSDFAEGNALLSIFALFLWAIGEVAFYAFLPRLWHHACPADTFSAIPNLSGDVLLLGFLAIVICVLASAITPDGRWFWNSTPVSRIMERKLALRLCCAVAIACPVIYGSGFGCLTPANISIHRWPFGGNRLMSWEAFRSLELDCRGPGWRGRNGPVGTLTLRTLDGTVLQFEMHDGGFEIGSGLMQAVTSGHLQAHASTQVSKGACPWILHELVDATR